MEVLNKTESACPQRPLVRYKACSNIKCVNMPKCWHGWAAMVKLNSSIPADNLSEEDDDDDDDRSIAPPEIVAKMAVKRSSYKKPDKSLTLKCSNRRCVSCKGDLEDQPAKLKKYVTEWGLEEDCVVSCVSKKCTSCGKLHPFFYHTKSMLFYAGRVVVSMSLLLRIRTDMGQAHSFSSALKAIQTEYLGEDIQKLLKFKRDIQNAFFAFPFLSDTDDDDLYCVICG